MLSTTELRNGRVALALHTLQAAQGMPLLLLHALGGSARDFGKRRIVWPGPVHALDFSGHGASGRAFGGGYYPELWVADADIALAALGQAVLLGAGVGAYVALLLAGTRAEHVPAVVLSGGAGLTGGGPEPRWEGALLPDITATKPARELQPVSEHDPAVLQCGGDVRPPDYARRFAALARRIVLLEDESEAPRWWRAVRELPGVARLAAQADDLQPALQHVLHEARV